MASRIVLRMARLRPALLVLALGVVVAGALAVALQLGPRSQGPTPAPSAAPTLAAVFVPPPVEKLPPGDRYTMPDFLPRITFEVEARGWVTYEWGKGFLHLSTHDGLSLQFVRPTGVYGVGSEPVPALTSAEAVEALSSIVAGRVVVASDSRIDGHTGKVVEVEHDERSMDSIAILQTPPDSVGVWVVPGRHLWVAFIDTPDGLLAIVVNVETAAVDRDMALVEPILESVTIGR
jgi:hypothetical protein